MAKERNSIDSQSPLPSPRRERRTSIIAIAGRPAADTLRMCVFDVSDRITFHEGQLIQDMFQFNEEDQAALPRVSSDIFAIKYDHWPIDNSDLSLVLVDEYLKRNREQFLKGENVERLTTDERLPSVDAIMEYIEEHYDALAISGSDDSTMNDNLPYLKILLPLIRKCVTKRNFPVFGICFGAQAIIRALKGDNAVSTMKKQNKGPEYGFLRYHMLRPNVLFDGVEDRFISTAYHGDCFLLDNDEKLVTSDYWDNQAFQIKDRKCFGVQFHPEFPKEFSVEMFNDLAKMEPNAKIVKDATSADLEPGRCIARNFVKVILEGGETQ
jgi:GMP synthase-like glutamine amidotransferase